MTDTTSKLDKIITKYNMNDAEVEALIDRIKNPLVINDNHNHNWGKRHIRIGITGDFHIGSLYTADTARDDYFKRLKKSKVDAIYNTGDLTEGWNMRAGHTLECELQGADAQVKGVIERIPDIGVPHYFITGNHDHAHWKNAGVDVGKWIDAERDDMHYLGRDNAFIELTEGTTLQLMHPAGGSSYAVSYRQQKIIESLSGGMKPSILATGHFHKSEYLFFRNVHAIQSGTFQAQTPFMQTKGLSAHVSGWILDIYTKRDGSIDRIEPKLFPYYD